MSEVICGRGAAKGSRWLDPASVPVGHPMSFCSCPIGPSPTFQCPYPAQVREAGNHRCAACATVDKGAARFLPSVLTPVPRWRSLLGTHWSCGRPERVAFAAWLDHTATRATWLASYKGCPPTGRVRKVRAEYPQIHIPPSIEPERRAKWVLA